MAKGVQLENGFTKIANRMLEIVYGTNFNATQLKIILCVIRYTWGFNRKKHSFSISFLSKATGVSKRYISDELKKLIDTKVLIIIKEHTTTTSRVLKLNKEYSQWIGYRTVVQQMNNSSTDEELSNTTDEQYFTTTDEQFFIQEINNKEKLKESSNTKTSIDEFFEEVWKLYPNKKGKTAVSKKSKETIYKIGIERMKQSINNYKSELKKDSWKQPLYGSTFFNSRYEDYLPVEVNKNVQQGEIVILTDEEISRMTKLQQVDADEASKIIYIEG